MSGVEPAVPSGQILNRLNVRWDSGRYLLLALGLMVACFVGGSTSPKATVRMRLRRSRTTLFGMSLGSVALLR